MRIAILVMAAGFSRRFKASSGEHKLLASLNGRPVLQHTLDHAVATGLDVFVVTRPEDRAIHTLIPAGRAVICRSAGIGDSIAAGVKATADYDGWLITLGDMPFIAEESLLAVADALHHAPLVRAQVEGKPGHPVGFQHAFYSALAALTGDSGARGVLNSAPCRAVALTDKGCLLDIDTRSDLQRTVAL
ncbi:NTP transferase domain-containing protein [Pantoea agglomerans]|uniref:nucleotidyltransferase family protein n=1 Tax=Enterobacter agglomerans TaxID=549 RepID=UPI001CCB1B90|nr:nucleotidyltransferase family protein [Pantoea agglomerans]UBN56254.1 nucleotidyltransferase family protein [Pantoea agglomerans]